MVLYEALELIHNHQQILCISHVGPDGDAVGSLLGMYWILRYLGKEPTAALQDEVPFELTWLPAADQIQHSEATRRSFDLIISLDASSPDRMGTVFHPEVHGTTPLLVIDHHITNTNFGTVNWVDAKTAATCQMLVDLAKQLNIVPDEKIATCLLTGIVTDTLCFRTSNTNEAVLNAATAMMNSGAELTEITHRTLDLRPFSAVKLAGLAMANSKLDEGVIWTLLTRAQADETIGDPGEANLNSILSRTVEADISAVFTEKVDNLGSPAVECSFRAKPGFDVGAVAFELGGGGHRPAAGCTIVGDLTEIVPRVVQRLKVARQVGLAERAE